MCASQGRVDLEQPTVPFSRRQAELRKGFSARDLLLLFLVVGFGFLLRLHDIGQPAKMYFDEIYYVDAADKLWSGQMDPNSVHPPLGKWLIGLGIRAVDVAGGEDVSQPFKWRFGSLVTGTAMVAMTYGLGLLLFNYNRTAATLAGLLVATDHLHLVNSRIAMLDPYVAFFCLLGIWGAFKYFLGGSEWWAVFSAFTLGLATGCKWSGLFTAFGCFMAGWWMSRSAPTSERIQRYFFWLVLLVPIGFFLTYLHLFIADGPSLDDFKTIFGQSERMVKFRADSKQFTHQYISSFWTWPLMLQPIWLLFDENKANGTVNAICAMGSPLFWWGFLLLALERTVYVIRAHRAKDKDSFAGSTRMHDSIIGALLILYLCQWLPWAVSFTGGFFYYMLTEVPIMALLVGKFLADLLNFEDALGVGRWRGWVILGLLAASAMVYYPFAVGRTTPRTYFETVFVSNQWVVGSKAQ